MDEFFVGEIIDNFKKMVLWVIVHVLFFTPELKDEACRHFYTKVVRIPGVCHGSNMVKGFKAIGQTFPQRKFIVRLDYVLGYVKIGLITAVTCLLFYTLAFFMT
jgi:hypothetical protein